MPSPRHSWLGSLMAAGVILLMAGAAGETSAEPAAPWERPRWPADNGTLVLIGGNWKATDPLIFLGIREAVKSGMGARCPDRPRVGVLCSANPNLRAAVEAFHLDDPEDPVESPSYRNWFRRMGFEPVFIPITRDSVPAATDLPRRRELVRIIKSCQVLFFTGGDQGRHAACFLRDDGGDTDLLRAIRGIYLEGGVIMGTSAGTHALGGTMFGWGLSYPTMVINRLEARTVAGARAKDLEAARSDNSLFLPGLGLLPAGVLTDTHFDARGRIGRLLVGMRDTESSVGIGVDENTALFVHHGIGKAVGENGVFVVEAPSAAFPASERFSLEGARLAYLANGDRFDFRTGRVTTTRPASRPQLIVPGPESLDILSSDWDENDNRRHPYAMTALLRRLALSPEPAVEGQSHEASPTFRFRVTRGENTRSFGGTVGGFTLEGAHLSVEACPLDDAGTGP